MDHPIKAVSGSTSHVARVALSVKPQEIGKAGNIQQGSSGVSWANMLGLKRRKLKMLQGLPVVGLFKFV